MQVVKGLDPIQYMGRWYEIAALPSLFQPKNSINTRATYTLNPCGIVHVCNETWSYGKRDCIQGVAYKADPKSNEAKFKVKFYEPPFLPIIPVVGNYWVLYLDDDYQYVMIGEPDRRYLWILSRHNRMDDEIYNMLVKKAKEEGYDVRRLKKTTHTDPPPGLGDAPTDTKGLWWILAIFGK
ncbi:hypothetical protein QVD17_22930 [Tagetes erecta]|uniref:Lipocalin/cytosolic fatty-acid binding domain-containing protein n=1 Tax=Tagetes erecta TaxID=13708 RepID=A0AAD8NTZ0_TARER|nr:hypothetical protein QVD17_22930 [Tagetes erecta]